jgi:hypothetical protein
MATYLLVNGEIDPSRGKLLLALAFHKVFYPSFNFIIAVFVGIYVVAFNYYAGFFQVFRYEISHLVYTHGIALAASKLEKYYAIGSNR